MSAIGSESPKIIRLCISGGRIIETFESVLRNEPSSLLAELAERQHYIDCGHRDRRLINILIDNLRKYHNDRDYSAKNLTLPENFQDWHQLIVEAQYWRLHKLEHIIRDASTKVNTITISYHGTLSVGKQGFTADVNFRRIHRILVSGRAWACREVFGAYLNETRDGNVESMRYTSRFYLTHTFLEQAFDTLALHGYKMITSMSTNPCTASNSVIFQMSLEEQKFLHYTQYVFVRAA